jgi:hypothetical protein
MSMQLRFSQTPQRFVALGLLILPIVAIVWLSLVQLSEYSQHQERVSLLVRQLDRYEVLTQSAPGWKIEVAKLRASGVTAGLLYGGRDAAMANAELRNKVSQIVGADGGRLSRGMIDPRPYSGKGPAKIAMTISFVAEAAQVVHVLHDLQVARPLVRVERMAIHNPEGEVAATASLTRPNRLRVDLLVTSYAVVS